MRCGCLYGGVKLELRATFRRGRRSRILPVEGKSCSGMHANSAGIDVRRAGLPVGLWPGTRSRMHMNSFGVGASLCVLRFVCQESG